MVLLNHNINIHHHLHHHKSNKQIQAMVVTLAAIHSFCKTQPLYLTSTPSFKVNWNCKCANAIYWKGVDVCRIKVIARYFSPRTHKIYYHYQNSECEENIPKPYTSKKRICVFCLFLSVEVWKYKELNTSSLWYNNDMRHSQFAYKFNTSKIIETISRKVKNEVKWNETITSISITYSEIKRGRNDCDDRNNRIEYYTHTHNLCIPNVSQ